jgi:hypothetical protein
VWKRSVTLRQIETFCARLNEGLTAVAVALAVAVTFTAFVERLSEIESLLQPIDAETGMSILSE